MLDLHFPDFMLDELARVRRICAWLGTPLRPDVEARMRAYLASHG